MIVLMCGTGSVFAIDTVQVSADESKAWVRYTVPLPKKIEIASKVTLSPRDIRVVYEGKPDIRADQAVAELRGLLGLDAAGGESKPFTLHLQIGGPGSADLAKLKYAYQAYRIEPMTNGNGLNLIAIDGPGLYYAAKTLQQLIKPRLTPQHVEVPMLRVTDWPDMEDRGLWGTDNFAHLAWMADRKMNIAEQISDVGVDENGKAFARIKGGREPIPEFGPKVAIKAVPVILHLEQVAGKGVVRAHPELAGKGGQEGCLCYSQPGVVDVIADWIVELASVPGVNEVDVWMTENLHGQGGCQCDQCKKQDRTVMEVKTIAAAWAKARQRKPNVGLRVLTSEETEKSNPAAFAVLPKGIKIWYYHSLLTYTAGESPMVRPYLEEFARKGRWIGMCPNLVSIIHFAQPFTGPHFVHYRMNEFIDKGMQGFIGYATPRVYYAFFNVEAAAEWGWNVKGRSTYEFSASWAVREGLSEPEKFADWVEVISPVAWDMYGSDWPNGEVRNVPGKVALRLKEGKLSDLGFVLWEIYRAPWGDVKSAEQLNRDVKQAAKAVEMAKALDRPEFMLESLIVQGYVNSLKALYELKQIVKDGKIADGDKPAARKWFTMYLDSLDESRKHLPAWEATLPLRPAKEDFTKRPVETITTAMDEMRQTAADWGVPLAGK